MRNLTSTVFKNPFYYRFCVLSTLFILLASVGFSHNNNQNSYRLFEYIDEANAMERLSFNSVEKAVIQLLPDAISSSYLSDGDILSFDINNRTEQFRITQTTSHIEDTYSVRAVSLENPSDYLMVTFQNSWMTGTLHTQNHSSLYHFRYSPEQSLTYIEQADPDNPESWECQTDASLHSTNLFTPGEIRGKTSVEDPESSSPTMSALASSLNDSITVDLLIAYTAASRAWAANSGHGHINSVIAKAMEVAQVTLDSSRSSVKLRLVHAHEVDYDETAGDASMSDHLQRFTASPSNNPFGPEFSGYMNDVHDLRNEYGADLMALFVDQPGGGGIGYILSQIGGSPGFSFSVSNVRVVEFGVLIHELGHNFGMNHSRDQNQNSADALGGIFEYSTGYRFQDNSGDRFSTIMAYPEGQYQSVAVFSSPEITHNSIPTGSYTDTFGPSDNARTIRETKRIISGYRLTQVDPPSESISQNSLQITMDREQVNQFPLFIVNNGDSDLMYEVDFNINNLPTQFRQKRPVPLAGLGMNPQPQLPETSSIPGSSAIFTAASIEDPELYQTDFSDGEGFSTGSFTAAQRWRSLDSDRPFKISSENPSNGSNHLRLDYIPDSESSTFIRSPYFGPQPFGSYEFSADISVQDNGNSDTRFDIYFLDSRSETFTDMTAGIILSDRTIHFRDENNQGETRFFAGESFNQNEYWNLRIVTDPAINEIRYYYNDNLAYTAPYTSGITFGSFWMIHSNDQADSHIDIDNIRISRLSVPFPWLQLDKYGGVVTPGSTDEVNLEFSTVGVSSGIYQGTMIIKSNDRDMERREIPLTLQVSGELFDPMEISLEQNFPNPFLQPEPTVIRFTLPEPANVKLQVFSVTGQLVTTILDQSLPAGTQSVPFRAEGLSSGVYIYQLMTDDDRESKKMVFIK